MAYRHSEERQGVLPADDPHRVRLTGQSGGARVAAEAGSPVRVARIDGHDFIEGGRDDITVVSTLLRRLQRRVLRPEIGCKRN